MARVSLEGDSGQAEPAAVARERIVSTAHDLFARYGLKAIGIDRIIAEAGVAKTTLYRHFRSKEELVLAVLQRREEIWLERWLLPAIAARGDTPEAQLLAIFDAFDEWFRRPDYEGCLFTKALFEAHDRTSTIGAACVMRLANVRAAVRGLAEQAGVRDADTFAHQWQNLMFGTFAQACGGHTEAAREARATGELLLQSQGLAPPGGAVETRAL